MIACLNLKTLGQVMSDESGPQGWEVLTRLKEWKRLLDRISFKAADYLRYLVNSVSMLFLWFLANSILHIATQQIG